MLVILDIHYKYAKNRLVRYLRYDSLEPQDLGKLALKCSCCICRKRKDCSHVGYFYMMKLFTRAKVSPFFFPVCQACVGMNRRELFINLKDCFVATALSRWGEGESSVIRNKEEYEKVRAFAVKKGILERERQRSRKSMGEKEQIRKIISRNLFSSAIKGECSSNVVFRALLKGYKKDH